MYYIYKGFYFKLKDLKRDYNYLPDEHYNTFCHNIVENYHSYLCKNNNLQLYNNLTDLSIKQQNDIILKSFVIPKPYKSIYKE